MQIYTKIKEARLDKNYTQEYVAKTLGIDKSVYSRMESGSHKIEGDQLLSLINLLGMNIDDLLSENSINISNNNNKEVNNQVHNINFHLSDKIVIEKVNETLEIVKKYFERK